MLFSNENNKSKCQIFTPSSLVDEMLFLINYNNICVGKKILENSFGDGAILAEIVRHYINSALDLNLSKTCISQHLSDNIYGIELDSDHFHSCLYALNELASSYNLPPVQWKLFNEDALFWETDVRFDIIIGNPPYMAYRDLDEEYRMLLKKKYSSCRVGKFDFYYAFLEFGISLLSDTGKLLQLIPSNLYKNVFAEGIRTIIKPSLSIVIDYPSQALFNRVLTSTSILFCDKQVLSDFVKYVNRTTNKETIINKKNLANKWIFTNKTNKKKDNEIRFGDFFNASISVATLLNRAFVISPRIVSEFNIEAEIIKETVSPNSLRRKEKNYIIFPYFYELGKVKRYSPAEFERLFPNASSYLSKFERELSLRKIDKNVNWYEFGRSQALAHLNQEKIVMSTVVTNKVLVYPLDKCTIPFSGIYITVQENSCFTLETAVDILTSESFLEYVKSIGICISGKSIRITCKDINNFKFAQSKYV